MGPGASALAGTGISSEASASVPGVQDTREGMPRLRESRGSSGNRERGGEHRDHRSRSPSRSGSRRRSSRSGSPESDSDTGYRRDRHRRSRRVSFGGFSDPTDPGWMSQLAWLLGPLNAGEVAKQTAHLPSTSAQVTPLLPPDLPVEDRPVTFGAAVEPPTLSIYSLAMSSMRSRRVRRSGRRRPHRQRLRRKTGPLGGPNFPLRFWPQ